MNPRPLSVYLIAFTSGAVVMAFEILGSRVLAPSFGSSVFVWGSLIGIFLAGLSAGYLLGGMLADRIQSFLVMGAILFMPAVLIGAFPSYGFSMAQWISDMELGPRGGPLLACLILFFIPSVSLGAVTPYSVKLLVSTIGTMGRGVGQLYAVSTAGSILGTLGTAFYLILWAGTRMNLVILGCTLALSAVLSVSMHFCKG